MKNRPLLRHRLPACLIVALSLWVPAVANAQDKAKVSDAEIKAAKAVEAGSTANEKMAAAEGIIIGSPTYFANVSTEVKALIDRAGLVSKANGNLFTRKIGAAVVAARRAGAVNVYQNINLFFGAGSMIVPGSSYWNIGIGRNPGEVLKDEEGMKTFRDLGRNMAWLIRKLYG